MKVSWGEAISVYCNTVIKYALIMSKVKQTYEKKYHFIFFLLEACQEAPQQSQTTKQENKTCL